ncbi:MAG: flagellin [Bdellovibrionales bacterium GWC1_52_8]|nr:MAG: flagellin [Bdellovibrionales bacterium GWB1_52_6]OFZ05270.1 MAG: flagellin [Bdellovibrionales bacterium GWA1_52_35]OFZ42796.1 MAG: flagellin [Bdellovibrionales bacterium GWC1_52_8]HCM38592.1 flagellin FliC [Bdellovibrionales bacterium]
MGLRINTNMAAISANRSLTRTSEEQSKVYQRLSSGQRITQAGDDAAGLSISENLRAQVRSMTQAERNANDGISFAQVAEGGLSEIGNIMIRMRELSVQAASDTIGDKERGYINQEVQSLMQEVDRIANVTTFNGTPLLNGQSSKDTLEFQVGTRNDEADRIQFNTSENDVRAQALGIDGMDYSTIDGAREAIDKVDDAIGRVFNSRARLGAMQNKLHATVNNLGIAKENLSQARSRIADTDIAAETSELVRGNILQSAGISVLAQANSAPMGALKLL